MAVHFLGMDQAPVVNKSLDLLTNLVSDSRFFEPIAKQFDQVFDSWLEA